MHDRFFKGLTAGITGMLLATILDVSAYALGISATRYLDVAGVLLWGDVPKATWEAVFGWIVTIGFCGLLGVVFAYLLPYIESKHAIIKGVIFGTASWFLIHALGVLYKVPLLEKSTPQTSFVHFVTAMIYGTVIGYSLASADRRIATTDENKNNGMRFSVSAPAYKLYDDLPQDEDSDARKK